MFEFAQSLHSTPQSRLSSCTTEVDPLLKCLLILKNQIGESFLKLLNKKFQKMRHCSCQSIPFHIIKASLINMFLNDCGIQKLVKIKDLSLIF